jgi:hypothetical protein
MSRFNFDSDYDDDEEKREQDEENLADDLFLKDQIISVQQENNDILKMEVEEKLLEIAIAVCQKSWFWSFRSVASKMRSIKRVYKQFRNLLLEQKF